ncbi:hypothetical protein RSP816_03415 [Ralstonia solanacearum]|nr:hypothetical protein RSP816_03415 [Ralstonia solanacearum]
MAPRNTGASAVIGAIIGGVPGNAISGGAGRTAATAATARTGTACPGAPRFARNATKNPCHEALVLFGRVLWPKMAGLTLDYAFRVPSHDHRNH